MDGFKRPDPSNVPPSIAASAHASPAPRLADARRAGARPTVEQPRRWRPSPSTETLVFGTSLWLALTCNQPFWRAILTGHDETAASFWLFAAALLTALTTSTALLLGILATRVTVRPLLAVALVVSATAGYYMERYGVYIDPGMVRNALHTESKEAIDLLNAGLFWHLLGIAGPALLVLAGCRPAKRPLRQALLRRGLVTIGTLALFAAALITAYPGLASPLRNHREIRYLITPANLIWAVGQVATADHRAAARVRQPIGLDATRAPATAPTRPRLLVLVVGETARAANWGLSGYARDTTPALRRAGVINFAQVTACGSDTETSLPCLFAPIGRRDYDEARIRGSESLLHVLARAGDAVQWLDNQTGCKGVCDGLPYRSIDDGRNPDCPPGRCLDQHLLDGLDDAFDGRDRVIVLHMIGSHGPAYDHRYPASQAFYQPVCGQSDLRRCSDEAIRNSYDNSLRYTDAVLSAAIERLRGHDSRYDTALLYVSDHGESLGEHRLYLHGIPWRIAPDVQTRVPMVLWLSDGLRRNLALDPECLARAAREPRSHDHVFHTVLGLLEVVTRVHEPSLDLISPCRQPAHLAHTP